MFAPSTIQIRYDDTGALGAAAAGVGAAQVFARQQAQDRQDEIAQAQALAQHRIQGSPTGAADQGSDTPFARSLRAQKYLAYSVGTGGQDDLDPDVEASLQAARDNPDIPAAQYQALLAQARKSGKEQTDSQQTQNAKAAYVKTLPPDIGQSLAALASDPKTSLNDIRIAAQQQMKQGATKAISPTTLFTAQNTAIRDQERPIQARMAALTKLMGAKGYSPETAPASFNPTYANPNAATFGTMGVAGSVRDALTGGGSLVSGGDPNAMKQMMLYYGLKAQVDALETQRQQLVQNALQQHQTDIAQQMQVEKHQSDMQQSQQDQQTQQQSQAPVPVQTPEQAAKLPKGTRFVTPDGKVFVR